MEKMLSYFLDFFKYFCTVWKSQPVSFLFYPIVTGGHFACACVHPLNDNSVGVFYAGFSLVGFSAVGFLGPLKTFKAKRQKVMFLYKSDFHGQSNAFLSFDFQTRGFTYQGGNAS